MKLCAESAAVLTLSLMCGLTAIAAERGAAPNAFAAASVHFEQNVTDGDSEVVFQVKAGKDGLAQLTIVSPTGRSVVAFKAPNASTLGIRQFRFESPEPADNRAVKVAYPEGVYNFSGTTFSGARFFGKATLSHQLPTPPTVISPGLKTTSVPVNEVKISWKVVDGAASYLVGVKQPESNINIIAAVPASATSFVVPREFLSPGKEYKLSIGSVMGNGNTSFVETTFTTAN